MIVVPFGRSYSTEPVWSITTSNRIFDNEVVWQVTELDADDHDVWVASKLYTLGDLIFPTTTNGRMYRAIRFNTKQMQSLNYLAENIRVYELYPKITQMIDYVVDQCNEQFKDVSQKWNKWVDPVLLSGSVEPTWSTTLGASTIDSGITWITILKGVNTPDLWESNHPYVHGNLVQPISGTSTYMYRVMVTEDRVQEIILESGYSYINDVLGTLNNVDYNILVYFLSVISMMKGSKSGLELVIKTLNLPATTLTEWWETNPKGTPDTYEMRIRFDDPTKIADQIEAKNKVLIFSENYVYPICNIVDEEYPTPDAESGAICGVVTDQFMELIEANGTWV